MILVTGATGTVGPRLVRNLRRADAPVRVLVRDPARAVLALGPDVELVPGDLDDPASVRAAVDGAERVFLATPNHPGQAARETTVIDCARAARVDGIVKLSAHGAAVGAPVAFWDTHGRIEAHLAQAGVPHAVLRPTFYMTGLLASLPAVEATGLLFAPAAGAQVAMIDPQDVADAAAALLLGHAARTGTWTLTGPTAVSFEDVAEAFGKRLGRMVRFMPTDDTMARAAMTEGGLPPWVADQLVLLFSRLRDGAQEGVTDDVSRLTEHPPRGLDAFMAEHVHGDPVSA